MVKLDKIDGVEVVNDGQEHNTLAPDVKNKLSAFRVKLIEACAPHFDAESELSGGDYIAEPGKETNGDVLSYFLARRLLRGKGVEDPTAYLAGKGILQPKLVPVSKPDASPENVGNDD